MIEKSKCHKLKLHYQNAMFWLFPDRRVSLTFEQVPAWFQKKQHFPVENLLVKNILTGWARDGNGGWVQEKELLRISAWVFCSVLLHPSQGLWGRSGAGNGTWTATHSQEHPLTELQNPIDLLCSSLCWGTNPDSNPEILWIIPHLWEKESWWSPALLGLGAADLALQCVPAHFRHIQTWYFDQQINFISTARILGFSQ